MRISSFAVVALVLTVSANAEDNKFLEMYRHSLELKARAQMQEKALQIERERMQIERERLEIDRRVQTPQQPSRVAPTAIDAAMINAAMKSLLQRFPDLPQYSDSIVLTGKSFTPNEVRSAADVERYMEGLYVIAKYASFAGGTKVPSTTAEHALTNEDVIAMKNAGLRETIIIQKIKTSPTAFQTDIERLKVLQSAEVSDAIIGSILESRQGALSRNQSPNSK